MERRCCEGIKEAKVIEKLIHNGKTDFWRMGDDNWHKEKGRGK